MREDYSQERCLGDNQKSCHSRVYKTWYRYKGGDDDDNITKTNNAFTHWWEKTTVIGVMTSSQKPITLLLIHERRLTGVWNFEKVLRSRKSLRSTSKSSSISVNGTMTFVEKVVQLKCKLVSCLGKMTEIDCHDQKKIYDREKIFIFRNHFQLCKFEEISDDIFEHVRDYLNCFILDSFLWENAIS